jgi:predicted RNA methylase
LNKIKFYTYYYKFVKETDMKFDTIVLDPPYNLRKAREKYDGVYIGSFTKIKNELNRILNHDGVIITLGYDTTFSKCTTSTTVTAVMFVTSLTSVTSGILVTSVTSDTIVTFSYVSYITYVSYFIYIRYLQHLCQQNHLFQLCQ